MTGGHSYGVASLHAIFNTTPTTAYQMADDGTFFCTITSDGHRQYLATLAKWYQNGWIDPEFWTDDRAADRQKFANGLTGIYSDDPWWWELSRGEVGPNQMLCATQGLDYATSLKFTTLWQSEVTGEYVYGSNLAWINGQASVYFGYDATDDMVIRMMKILDETVRMYTFDEEDKHAIHEMAVRSSGVEGVNWHIDETGRAKIDVPLTADEQNEMGAYLFPCAADYDLGQYVGQDDEFNKKNYEEAMSLNKVYKGSNVNLPTLSTISTELSDMSVNVNDYASTCRSDFVTGAMDINDDAVWAEYIATLEEYGINEICKAYEEYFAAN